MSLAPRRDFEDPEHARPALELLSTSEHPVPADRIAPARGVLLGLALAAAAFWIPITAIVIRLVR